jgi:hypothetical protein
METKIANPKICLFMWYDSRMEKYGDVTYELNKRYCNKYGYTLIRSNKRNYLDRTPHWERLPLILANINNYDYIMWIDADAYFHVDSPPITNVIKEYPTKEFFVSKDVDTPKYDRNVAVNSGFFIAKNTPSIKFMFYEWAYYRKLYDARYGFSVGNNTGLFQDQGVLRLMLDKNLYNLRDKSIILDYGILQFFPEVNTKVFPGIPTVCAPTCFGLNKKPFICHWSKFNANDRYARCKKYFDSVNKK